MCWLFLTEGLFVTPEFHLWLYILKALHIGVPPYPPFISLNQISPGDVFSQAFKYFV